MPLDWLAAVPRNQSPKGTVILVFSIMVNVGVILRQLKGLIFTAKQEAAWGLATKIVMTKTPTNVLEKATKTMFIGLQGTEVRINNKQAH